MALREEMEAQGNWLFRWRSYLPLALLPLLFFILYDIRQHGYIFSEATLQFYTICCIIISFLGLLVRILVIGVVPAGTSGRNTVSQRANELNTKGIYSVVRHPLYLGNYLIILGIVMSLPVWWGTVIYSLLFMLYYERIMLAEEAFLRGIYKEKYMKWAETTPAFIPSFTGWVKSDLPFSIRNILKREYPGFFAIVAAYTIIELLQNIVIKDKIDLAPSWSIFFISGLVIYLTLRTLKKKTKLLHIEGR